jgi:hypothetical protein
MQKDVNQEWDQDSFVGEWILKGGSWICFGVLIGPVRHVGFGLFGITIDRGGFLRLRWKGSR